MASKANHVEQILALPSGGGAMRGIGESFVADLHSGTANLTLPIEVPSGRNGFGPRLNLVFSSAAGNGPFGLGWSLGIPQVSRKTSHGVPRYGDELGPLVDRDVFLLSGAEDLVAISSNNGVVRYRPRTEGLFVRIEHVVDARSDYWRVSAKDGSVHLYGTPDVRGDDPGVISDPRARDHVATWRLTRSEDSFGNVIAYDYERDHGDTTDHLWDQIYLRQIRFVDHGEDSFLVSVAFDYDERPDPFSDYRSGFEIRTRKRCRAITVRTHSDRDRIQRIYHLSYLDQAAPKDTPANRASLLARVLVEGVEDDRRESMPPLELGYTTFEPAQRRHVALTGPAGSRPARSLADRSYELVDLHGHGLPSIIEIDGQVRYWRNLGNGRFDRMRTMDEAPPDVRLGDRGVQLLDANGDGRADLMLCARPLGGYFPLTFDGQWSRHGFVPYRVQPSIDLDAPDVRLIDLDGDGVTDALRTGREIELYYNDPDRGWDRVETRVRGGEVPDVTFRDPRVWIADMSGDGLQDIAVIESGRLTYWPYLGHGRWGRRVTMRNAPRFDDAAAFPGTGFDPRRLLIGDIDGDGLADLAYVASGHVTVWVNQGGNGWSDPIVIRGTPPVTDGTAIRLVDMLGTGTAGILWTYDEGSFRDSTYKFLDLTGGNKPYLLERVDNHLGALTQISYASSTRYYLADESDPETRWRTTLPFPVHVVARVEVVDQIARNTLTTEYRYHHGHWDGVEREFRGFAQVEQFDTESFASHSARGPSIAPVPEAHFAPPLLTRTWFDVGPVGDVGLDLSSEYWVGDPSRFPNEVPLAALSNPRDRRDALRALRGVKLRAELYALDGSPRQDRPFTVTEQTFSVREESPASHETVRPRIFFPHLIAQRTTEWERGEDPRTRLGFTDAFDAYGQPCREITIAVPRGRDYAVDAATGNAYLATTAETQYAQRDDDGRYLVDRVAGTRSFEIENDGATSAVGLCSQIRDGTATKKLFAQMCNYYDGDAFVGLPFGQVGNFGAPVRSEVLVHTEEQLAAALGGVAAPPYLVTEDPSWTGEYPDEFRASLPPVAGYVFADGSDHRARGYYAHGARTAFDFQLSPARPRGLPLVVRDPLGNDTTITYDEFSFLVTRTTDALGLSSSAEHDYRVLQPRSIEDVNGNRCAVVYGPLGMVSVTAAMGKLGEEVGDTLATPGSRFDYDFHAFEARGQPISVRSTVREHHVTARDVPVESRDRTLTSVQYSDGFGRVVQSRAQAEDVRFGDDVFGGGLLPADPTTPSSDIAGRRRPAGAPNDVRVTGALTYDNKGRIVEAYEPYFAGGFDYAAPADDQRGHKTTTYYDARGRVARTVAPDGSEQRIVYGVPVALGDPDRFTPTVWESYAYDANDLAPLTGDPDNRSLADRVPEAHHFTPTSVVFDALGRTTETIQRNGRNDTDRLRTTATYDIRGNLLTTTDALGRIATRQVYDFLDRPWASHNIDAGARTIVLDAVGGAIEQRDSKGALVLRAFDRVHRPARVWGRDRAGAPIGLRQRLRYGDEGTSAQTAGVRAAMRANNLLGRLVEHHDEAGRTTIVTVDFKGNILERSRTMVADAPVLAVFDSGAARGWDITPFRVDWELRPGTTLGDREGELLESTAYQTTFTLDALDRVTRVLLPAAVDGRRREAIAGYDAGGTLERIELDGTAYVERIAYDALGARVLVARGNGVVTRYVRDPRTRRLVRIRSERMATVGDLAYRAFADALQDSSYTHDLVGNLVALYDRTPGSGVLDNPVAGSVLGATGHQLARGDAFDRAFDYDPLYRLLSATGRECDRPTEGPPWIDIPRCTDVTRAHAYTERYTYDATGGLTRLEHRGAGAGFVRRFDTDDRSNRIRRMRAGSDTFDLSYDDCGNQVAETGSRRFTWTHDDQLAAFAVQTDGAEPSMYVHYLYDGAGQRVKKLARTQGGRFEVTHYLDGVLEEQRWSGPTSGANTQLQVLDGPNRVATIRIGPAHPDDASPAVQYCLADHLGSCEIVTDATAAAIRREEYTPYGETSFGSFARKRYRFMGCERDAESGLVYCGARYLAPYRGRWISCDPLGAVDGDNLYQFAAANPMTLVDPGGTSTSDPNDTDNAPEGVDWQSVGNDIQFDPESGTAYFWQGDRWVAGEPIAVSHTDYAWTAPQGTWSRVGDFYRGFGSRCESILKGAVKRAVNPVGTILENIESGYDTVRTIADDPSGAAKAIGQSFKDKAAKIATLDPYTLGEATPDLLIAGLAPEAEAAEVIESATLANDLKTIAAEGTYDFALGLSKHPNHGYKGLVGRFADHVKAKTYWDLFEDTSDMREMGENLLKGMRSAKNIHFNLDGMVREGVTFADLVKFGSEGIGQGNVANWELFKLVTTDLKTKATFYLDGKPITLKDLGWYW